MFRSLTVALFLTFPFSVAAGTPPIIFESAIAEHGGGCRKSSPPGQCCHMEKRVGRVHCH
jgi:hypothetical protein